MVETRIKSTQLTCLVAIPPANHDTLHLPVPTHPLCMYLMQINNTIAVMRLVRQTTTPTPRVNVESEVLWPVEPQDIILDIRRTMACWVRLEVLSWVTFWKIN